MAVTARRDCRVEDTVPLSAAPPDMAPTSFDLDPRAPEDAAGNLEPAKEAPSLQDDADAAV